MEEEGAREEKGRKSGLRRKTEGFKTLEIWESIVKPWINLSIKGRRERTRIIQICKRAACPRLSFTLIDRFSPTVFSGAVDKVERSIPEADFHREISHVCSLHKYRFSFQTVN